MESSKGKFAENNDGSSTVDEVAENYVLKLNDLEIEDPKMSDENPVSGSSSKPKSISPSDKIILPSEVTDQPYIYLHDDDFKIDEGMQDGGKWMLFTHRDLQKLDHYWTSLKTLFLEGTLVGLKASTASNPDSGVINCYTGDSGNWVQVKKAAVAIRDVIDYPFIMYYKTNEASAQGQYREKGYKLISRYMFTIKGGFYEKDKYGRWEWI